MKGDFSRIRFNSAKLYTAVLEQQGRVDLDADANEQRAIDVSLRETTNADLIGPFGGPQGSAGFAISVEGDTIWISAGRYYVEGILVEIPTRVSYDQQPYLDDPLNTAQDLLESLREAPESASLEFVLEVWQRLATALDDPCLLEPALNQADTTARLQTVWRVVGRLRNGAIDVTRDQLIARSGMMGASPAGGGNGCGCQPIPAAGYQGVENQLYRVEIHTPGDLSSATFKWSRENGSVVTQVTQVVSGSPTITVASLGPDANLGFQAGQWVELSDDSNQFGVPPNQPGVLYQIYSVDTTALQVTMTAPVTGVDPNNNARMRRWDQSGATLTSAGVPVSSTPIQLENGIEVELSKGQYQAGDYWTIPARTANGSIEWPPCGGDGRYFQPPASIPVYKAPLACITELTIRVAERISRRTVVRDQRSFFPPLAASAIHIQETSWKNDETVALDALLDKGLSLILDAAPTSALDAAVFRVSLEVAVSGTESQGIKAGLAADAAKNQLTIDEGGQNQQNLQGSGIFGLLLGVLRQELVLDGILRLTGPDAAGWTLSWKLPIAANAALIYRLNAMLAAYGSVNDANAAFRATPPTRVRVRLFGHMIFAEARAGVCGPTKTIYLDGQSFGTPTKLSDGTNGVLLKAPSGNSAVASDFESWFYLTPVAMVESVDFDPSLVTVSVGETAPSSATSTGTVYLARPVATDVTIQLTADTVTGVTLSFSASSIVIAAGETFQTFTATVQASAAAANGSVVFTVTATPQLETEPLSRIFSAEGTLSVTVENPLTIATTSLPSGVEGKAYTATLEATGGTPSYKWSQPTGAGTVADGLTLNADGTITGTAGRVGEFKAVVQVTDSASPAATVSKELPLEVYAPLTITTQSPLPSAAQDGTYETRLDANGGKTPYKWRRTAGTLPSGFTLSEEGVLTGTTNDQGDVYFTVEVVDSASPQNKTTRNFELEILESAK